MVSLPNNCRYSGLSVYPSDWETCAPDKLVIKWNINYMFYDDNTGQRKQIRIRDFNRNKTLKSRRAAVHARLALEQSGIEEKGYNPIQGTFMISPTGPANHIINKYSPVMVALRYASTKLKQSTGSMNSEVNPHLKDMERAVKLLEYETLPICNIGVKNLYNICEKGAIKQDGKYSSDKHNRIVKVLGYLYKVLVKEELVLLNYAKSLEKDKLLPKEEQQPISLADRQNIDKYWRMNSPEMWLFTRIFWYSGARTTELLKVQRKHVDLDKKVVTYLVLKNNRPMYKKRPILDVAVEYWQQACNNASLEDYIFGRGVTASKTPIEPNVIKKRWQRMEDATGITGGMYRLKHTHTTGAKKQVGTKGAALLNAESEEMIKQVYDLDHDKDEMDSIRGVNVVWV